jgi:predicted Zn-dependent protease with MMP-like domain
MGMPKEIRDFLQTTAVEIKDVIPIDAIKKSQGHLAPTTCVTIESVHSGHEGKAQIINLFQKNIENLASKKQEIRDLIASALLHELGKLAQKQDR